MFPRPATKDDAMTKLSDTQSIILSAAAQRADGNVLPLPGSLRGGAATKVVAALLARGLIREQIIDSPRKADAAMNTVWRNLPEPDGRAVLLFMLFYYRFAGMVACVALFANLLLTVGFMVAVNAAFTLPGLAFGFMVAMLLAFAWQRSLWANIRGQIQAYARHLVTTP